MPAIQIRSSCSWKPGGLSPVCTSEAPRELSDSTEAQTSTPTKREAGHAACRPYCLQLGCGVRAHLALGHKVVSVVVLLWGCV